MPTRRMIEPSIWQSESIGRLTIRQRLMFIGMFSNADDQGRLRSAAAVIRSMILPYDDVTLAEVEDDIQAIQREKCILLYSPDGTRYAQIINWWKYQKHQWAYPSLIPKPDGWSDRLRYRHSNTVITENWIESDQNRSDQSSIDQNSIEVGKGLGKEIGKGKGKKPPKDSAEKAPRPANQSAHNEAITALVKVFEQWSYIPAPNGTGPKGTAATRWYAPLNRILTLCGKDTTKAAQLIKDAIDKMRQDKLTISAPQSIENVAISIYGNGQSDRDRGDRIADSWMKAMGK